MAPTPTPTPGVKGHRPVVGTWDRKGPLYAFAAVNLVTAAVHANTLGGPKGAEERTGLGEARRTQAAFAAHPGHVARACPAERHKRVAPLIGNGPWRRGRPIDEAPRDHPHPESKRLPGNGPQLNPIERSWKLRRRRSTHSRPFDPLADLKASVRSSLCYSRTARGRIETLLDRRSRKQSQSPGS